MATFSSILAWRIPWIEESGRLQFMGSQRVRHDWVTKHSTAGTLQYIFILYRTYIIKLYSLNIMLYFYSYQFSLFSHSVVSNSLWTHRLPPTRLPCLSPTPRACSNSCPWSQWSHPTISSCRPLFFLPSIFPSIRVFSNQSVLWIKWESMEFQLQHQSFQ